MVEVRYSVGAVPAECKPETINVLVDASSDALPPVISQTWKVKAGEAVTRRLQIPSHAEKPPDVVTAILVGLAGFGPVSRVSIEHGADRS